MANRGYYYTPHIIKSIQDTVIDEKYTTKHYTTIDEKYFEPVVEGMYLAVNGSWGSTARIAKLDSIEVCGKTGTAQNPHGKDHSLFICFAPKDNPKIAVAICVENSGFGATFAAPMASLMVEKYLKGYIPDNRKWIEERMLNTNLITSE
jgi:penicillin-binding protein 2